ncbi:type III effector protein [Ralstonia pseudosolanacearum]|uniref:type III effector protein n=1 Tax=Ralstonia solanacearum species complex TaxID=3116862 RepID=UPI000B9A0635|nr:type III effector protein [Ralstonia pseudosolanacearum]NKA04436.1 RipU-effector family protein [Ralstonia solanacearum]AST89280.1 type III effector protein [Ralstonia pseudosolanacearum]NKA54340.1 RipU-effector family protein [Ralstonia solanacearum]NKA66879.1 RipU-effector family protein [Ralstonia solanacearum]NKA84338.1 RipU-effector family protein [Ralstonia solanacearum]
MNRVRKSGTTHVAQTPSTPSDPASTPQTSAAQVRPRSASLPLKALKALKSAGQLAIGPMRDALGAAGIAKSSGKSPRQAPAEDYIGSLRSKIRPSPSSLAAKMHEDAPSAQTRAYMSLPSKSALAGPRHAPAADGAESSAAAAARVPKKVKFNDVVLKEEFIDKPRSRKEGEVLGRSSSIRLGSPDGGGYVHQRPDKLRAAQNVSGRKILINQQAEALSTMGDAHPGAAAAIKKALAKKQLPSDVLEALEANGMNTRSGRAAVIKRFNEVEKDTAELKRDAAASEPPPQDAPQ